MNTKKAVLFTGGKCPDYKKIENIIKESDIIVAADSGWDSALSMEIIPDIYIGDKDSIKNIESLDKLENDKKFIYPKDKDYTDTELALNFLKEKNYKKISLIGGGEGRLDHLLAITASFTQEFPLYEWFTALEHVVFANTKTTINCNIDQIISIFASRLKKAIVSTKGLKWELEKFLLDEKKFSISNRALKNKFTVDVLSGSIIIILNY